ncbi:dTDP-rhamnosyl transferase RfbF [Pectobacterium carotovorum subsp. carotovorum]|uniref:glycosyltransferase family 2 protein n=1 Tax=Pectobacterium brasiliense TaxID=180957 RepID=UPI0020832DB7|nr:glycosyltransferase family 2 protein [Pectobacterium brasiliense]MDY4335046.1 glycosyltransferase family 2 protein [Pectobacterium brasiliense]GKV76994.1 dTDP-rhamnosyl transferase RfbF [Pectobacterium carotovorum subsp. carotovorum]
MGNKIYSVVVTFSPDLEQLKKLLVQLEKKTDYLILCNNSDDELPRAVYLDIKNVNVLDFKKNVGIAKAQSIGMQWAFSHGADFVLQMDQDSVPDEDMVEELLICYRELSENNIKVGLVGSQDFDKYTGEKNKARVRKGNPILKDEYVDVSCTLSSGSLIPKLAYDVVGGMYDELFIDAVDHEYCWRLKKHGFKVIRNKRALLGHRLGDGKYRLLPGVHVGLPSPFRHYYAVRNIFILLRHSYVPLYWKVSSLCKLMLKLLLYPILMPNGKERLYFISKGIKDGILNKTGKFQK